ncbi:23S rRNA (adenine(1618)-N(6))-methyltransferase RlmF [Sediminibacter sp. Hel_I_10]|uniref:23S rRNA (adenine(1618)-N(6))-methyltransferase RlmF n=1 Tax=Sediminibacter sp. Hel_I_10 TaxID=1392490 RepID=UPI00047A8BEF|nr:23S rRNA (adenine(1618)-N(6))-methyltransferase RlmF [Sediminibacter sp. Hel_I_10]
MHKNNKHSENYDFQELVTIESELAQFVHTNKFDKITIDFSNSKAVKILNKALLKKHYGIQYWEFPNEHLCPPIPGRVEYIHVLNDLLKSSGLNKDIKILDIGTGATCIYPLLGSSEYGWHFIASELDQNALKNAEDILRKNDLKRQIELRFQENPQRVLEGILKSSDKISAAMCNPPFYKNEMEAEASNEKKLKGLGLDASQGKRNFSGTSKELIYPGGEKAFLHNYLYQSSLQKKSCFWFTSLVSKKELIKTMKSSLEKLGATEFKVIQMELGNKISRVVAWSFLNPKEQEAWKNSK